MISRDLEVLIAVTLKKLSALAFVIIGVVKDSCGQSWLSGALVYCRGLKTPVLFTPMNMFEIRSHWAKEPFV